MKTIVLLFIGFLSILPVAGLNIGANSPANDLCKCYTGTPKGGKLTFRRTPEISTKNIIEKLPTNTVVTLLEKSVKVQDGHVWHKIQYKGTVGYVAHWVHCKEVVPSKSSDRTFYGDRLLDDNLAKVIEPTGKNNQALILKWYKRYKTEEYYQGAARRGWERISKGSNLEFIYNECLKESVPYETVLLALIESSWYPHKNNSAYAAGYWQFIPATARAYGLKVDTKKGIDDRLSVEKSTRAAIKYLKDLSRGYEKGSKTFSDRWCFTYASYNRGPGKVKDTFKQCKGSFSKYPDYIATSFSETRNYVPKIFGLRKFLKEYVTNKAVTEVYKSPADLAYEGYLEKKEDMPKNKRVSMLTIISGMYKEEILLKSYGEDRDDAYTSGALKEINGELKDLK